MAAKHGLAGFSRVVALEGGLRGVTSNCIDPAYVRTPLVERQLADQARTRGIAEEEVVEKVMLAESAIKRLIEPGDPRSAANRGSGLRLALKPQVNDLRPGENPASA